MSITAAIRLAVLAGALCLAAPAPAAARQRPDTLPTAVRDASRPDTASGTLPGPRIPARWQHAEQRLVPAPLAPASAARDATFHFTTLELILICAIVLILVVH